ncbi:MAG TPA: copper resistance CopC family protein [Streptosporangiaceae bacterium]
MEPAARTRAVAATLVTALLSVVTAVLIGVVAAGPASAHTSLKSASPADGATVRPPDRIVLTYDDPVRFTQVLVTDGTGRQYQSGSPVNVDNTVTESLASALPNGRYTVAWRVVSLDGHPVEGTYQFTVAGSTAATPSAAPAASGGQPAATTKSSGTSVVWIVVIVALIAAAAVGAMLLLRQSASDPEGGADGDGGGGADGDGGGDRGPDAAGTGAGTGADSEAGAGH